MFNTNINERKDIISSKLEYTKKKRFLSNEDKFQNRIEVINKVINNETITQDEYKIFLSQLEYNFKKKLLDKSYDFYIDNEEILEKIKTKTDKALYILKNIQIEE